MSETPSISFFFPAFNDEATIGRMVEEADQTVGSLTNDYEIIVVDDASQDGTARVLEAAQASHPKLRVFRHATNRGYGGALRSGFRCAGKELICYTDGDGQYDPRELRQLLEALSDSVDVVQGYKIRRQDPFYRVVIGRAYCWAVKLLFGLRVRDVNCDYRLLRRRVFDRVRLEFDSGAVGVELLKKIRDAGFRIVEVPVRHYPRIAGKSQFFRVDRIARSLLDLFALRLGWRRASRSVEGRVQT